SPQVASDSRNRGHHVILRAARDQFLRQRHRRLAIRLSTLCGPMEPCAHPVVDGDFILQRAQVSTVSGLLADHTGTCADPARVAGWSRSEAGTPSGPHGVWTGTAVLLRAAPVSPSRISDSGVAGISPAHLA